MREGKQNGTGRNTLHRGSVIIQWGMEGLTHSQLRAPLTMGISLQPSPQFLTVWPWEERGRERRKARAGQSLTIPRLSLSVSPTTHTIARNHTFRPLSCASSSFTRFSERWERSHKRQSPSNEPFVYRGNKKYACVTRILPVLSVNCNYLPPANLLWYYLISKVFRWWKLFNPKSSAHLCLNLTPDKNKKGYSPGLAGDF